MSINKINNAVDIETVKLTNELSMVVRKLNQRTYGIILRAVSPEGYNEDILKLSSLRKNVEKNKKFITEYSQFVKVNYYGEFGSHSINFDRPSIAVLCNSFGYNTI